MRGTQYVIVGRDGDCDVVVVDPSVSGRHAKLSWRGRHILVEDLGSSNGVFVLGRRVRRAKVRPGDEVLLGKFVLPWSHRHLREFLKSGSGGDTVITQVRPQDIRKRRKSQRSIAILASALVGGVIGAAIYPTVIRSFRELTHGSAPRMIPSVASPEEASIMRHTARRIANAINSTHVRTRNTAVQIAAGEQGPYQVEQVALLWTTVRSRWRYVSDPGGDEYFATASETIDNGYVGDCDDFAILLAALVQSIGGRARIVMMDGDDGGHAYAEACVPSPPSEVATALERYRLRTRTGGKHDNQIHFRSDATCETWLNLDWNAGQAGGPYERESWAVAVHADGSTQTLAPNEKLRPR